MSTFRLRVKLGKPVPATCRKNNSELETINKYRGHQVVSATSSEGFSTMSFCWRQSEHVTLHLTKSSYNCLTQLAINKWQV